MGDDRGIGFFVLCLSSLILLGSATVAGAHHVTTEHTKRKAQEGRRERFRAEVYELDSNSVRQKKRIRTNLTPNRLYGFLCGCEIRPLRTTEEPRESTPHRDTGKNRTQKTRSSG